MIILKTIENYTESELIIKNSRFITCLFHLDKDNIDDYLNSIKTKYPKATHYCYAYIFEDYKKSSDDGEPSGTAGFPILNVLEKEDLINVLVVVVRYFGGIKLGAGGLVRAYTKSVTEALKNATFPNLVDGYEVFISFNYEDEKDVLYILKNSMIIDKNYSEHIIFRCLIDSAVLNKLSKYDVNIIKSAKIKEIM